MIRALAFVYLSEERRPNPLFRWGEASLAVARIEVTVSIARAAALVNEQSVRGTTAQEQPHPLGEAAVLFYRLRRVALEKVFDMRKGTLAQLDWNQVQVMSLAGKSIEVITDKGHSQGFEFSTEQEARKAFDARSSGRIVPRHEK